MTDRKEYLKNYAKTPQGKKNRTINNWKYQGLKETNEFIDQIYDEYLRSEECQLCGEPYSEHNIKNMEHNHETGEFRNICCHRCNTWKADLACKSITWCKKRNNYRVQIHRNYKSVLHKRGTEQECREILDKFIMDYPHYFT